MAGKIRLTRRGKYGSTRTVVDGISFASKKEAARWSELRLLEKEGKIHNLERQSAYRLMVNGMLVCKYMADFRYVENGVLKVEDVKSPSTRRIERYVIKKKLMKAVWGIDIIEV